MVVGSPVTPKRDGMEPKNEAKEPLIQGWDTSAPRARSFSHSNSSGSCPLEAFDPVGEEICAQLDCSGRQLHTGFEILSGTAGEQHENT